MADKSVDEPLKKKEEGAEGENGEEENADEIPEKEKLYEYFYPELLYIFIQKRWGSISAVTAVIYSIHLFFAIYGVDRFTDISRLRQCKSDMSREDSSSVY